MWSHPCRRSQDGFLADDLPAELRRRGGGGAHAAGLPPLLARLQEAAGQRRGTAEELATLFVALLRAASCLTRLVRRAQGVLEIETQCSGVRI
jgi:hypothetical protein